MQYSVFSWICRLCGCVVAQSEYHDHGVQPPQSYPMQPPNQPSPYTNPSPYSYPPVQAPQPFLGNTGLVRPDISNIDNLGEPLRSERLREALAGFLGRRYALGTLLPPEQIAQGLCLGIGLRWVASALTDNAVAALDFVSADGALQAAISSQTDYESTVLDPNAGSSFARLWQFLSNAQNTGPLRISAPAISAGVVGSNIAGRLHQVPGSYLVALEGIGVGHVISVAPPSHRNGPDYTIFDPQIGEFRAPASDLAYFFDALIARYATLGWRFTDVNLVQMSLR